MKSACREADFSPHAFYEVPSVVSQIAYVCCGVAIGMVPSWATRFGGSDVVFRPLVEMIKFVSIAAAFKPSQKKDLVPRIVEIAAVIGPVREALPSETAIKRKDAT
jgi:DNA-binding transcriptional LysR family regulator